MRDKCRIVARSFHTADPTLSTNDLRSTRAVERCAVPNSNIFCIYEEQNRKSVTERVLIVLDHYRATLLLHDLHQPGPSFIPAELLELHHGRKPRDDVRHRDRYAGTCSRGSAATVLCAAPPEGGILLGRLDDCICDGTCPYSTSSFFYLYAIWTICR